MLKILGIQAANGLSDERAKAKMGLLVRTIGSAKAKTKIGMANLAYNIRRLARLARTASA